MKASAKKDLDAIGAEIRTLLERAGRRFSGHRRGRGVDHDILEVEIYVSGYTSASHASGIDEKIRELGAYAVKAGRFDTEWECEKGHFFVGTDEQVAVAESADALERIQSLAPKLRGDDITAALDAITSLQQP